MFDSDKTNPIPGSIRLRLVVLALVILVLVGLAAAWSWSPMRQWLDGTFIVTKLEQFGRAFGPSVAILGFTAALIVAIPLTFLTLVTLVAYGPWLGFLISLSAATLGAAVTFQLGKLLGHEVVRRIGGPNVNLVSQRLSKRGVLAVIAIRMVPIAPFAIINMIAGATHLRLRDMLIGTLIGMTPGTLIMMFFVDQIMVALKQPSMTTVLIVGVLGLLIVIGIVGVRKWLAKANL
jgi:uncharacterized membrane protein YdjX (TVP38/TMEM64 family)